MSESGYLLYCESVFWGLKPDEMRLAIIQTIFEEVQ